MSFKCCFILLFVLLISSLVNADNIRPVIPGYQVTEAPRIDGDISDPCWEKAPAVDDFYLPSDGSKAEEPTIVKICYDEKNIYVAFRCFDSHPEGIVAKESKRGADIANDDWYQIMKPYLNPNHPRQASPATPPGRGINTMPRLPELAEGAEASCF